MNSGTCTVAVPASACTAERPTGVQLRQAVAEALCGSVPIVMNQPQQTAKPCAGGQQMQDLRYDQSGANATAERAGMAKHRLHYRWQSVRCRPTRVLCGSSPQTCGPNWRVRTSRLLPTAPRSREALQKGHDCLPGPQIGGGGTRRAFGMAPHRMQSGSARSPFDS
jgi:hypothetical protein